MESPFPMMPCALLLTLSGALLVYLAHPQQRLLRANLPGLARGVGTLAVLAGVLAWCGAAGIGAGLAGALTCLMSAWVALPYLAWWRGAALARRR